MTSKFQGRDYSTLRSEIINFLRQRLPSDWDYTNLADPVVVFAESLARVGDQLHFTIDELRRECDIATANRASSVYSYASREGYKLMLPRGASGTITINSSDTQSNMLHLSIKRFDEIPVITTGEKLYAANDIDADLQKIPTSSYVDSLAVDVSDPAYKSYVEYVNHRYKQTQRLKVVLGTSDSYKFSYGDINDDATVTLPDPLIDRNLIQLLVTLPGRKDAVEWQFVEDIIAAGFVGNIYTLTTKFIGGAIVLSIEFATNYRDLFPIGTTFTFNYIKINNSRIDNTDDNNAAIDLSNYISVNNGYENDNNIRENGPQYIVNLGSGIKGYTEFEDPNITRMNYKKFVQSYSALLTKDDFTNYIKTITSTHCNVYDHSDNYKDNVLPYGTALLERAIYILTEALYDERESLWRDLTERTSRSDCIILMPYGKDPYTIVVKAECFLLGTSVSDIATKIKSSLLSYYSGDIGSTVPTRSMIDHLVHSASDKVIYSHSVTVRDSKFGSINSDFNDVATLSNDDIDNLFKSIVNNDITTDMGKRYLRGVYTRQRYIYYPITFPVDATYADYPSKFEPLPKANTEPTDFNSYSDYIEGTYPTFATYLTNHKEEFPGSDWEAYVNDPVNNPYDPKAPNGLPGYEDYCKDYIDNAHILYDKYPAVEYKQFPDAFPAIYKVSGKNKDDEIKIEDYLDLVKLQTVYGSIDSKEWDYSDNKIIIPPVDKDSNNMWESDNYQPTPGEVPTMVVDPYYIKHHYMVPVLNRVVVLVKAIGN